MLCLQSTLLKALAGKLKHSGLALNGSVLYNGTPLTEFLPQRTAVYVEQEDQHLPELTVRETFDFAARCQGVGSKAGQHPSACAVLCCAVLCCAVPCRAVPCRAVLCCAVLCRAVLLDLCCMVCQPAKNFNVSD